ncbi:L,D-transpeptidase [Peribacillus kribbensis]|uniref:L,D-transpeptidase n=1 Tax=Peribacillus kribbensis TaxID=356658 RepID=UPI00041683E6|nr:L,D-transpeptidase [Peribacillus kribbensis]
MAARIEISTKNHQLYVMDGIRLIKAYPIAVGKMLTPTPEGTYKIINKQPNPGGPFGVMWMGLSKPTYGIHGTDDPSSIGRDMSHGCIRMQNADVQELSSMVPIGTVVRIHKWFYQNYIP